MAKLSAIKTDCDSKRLCNNPFCVYGNKTIMPGKATYISANNTVRNGGTVIFLCCHVDDKAVTVTAKAVVAELNYESIW